MDQQELDKRKAVIYKQLNDVKRFYKALIAEISDSINELESVKAEIPKDFMIIVDYVMGKYNMNISIIRQRTREGKIKECRQVIFYIQSILLPNKYTLKASASYLGLVNHATVIHSINTICDRMTYDKYFANSINDYVKDCRELLNKI